MAKFIGWVVIIVLVLVGISALINEDDESSDSDKTESLKPEKVEALNDEKKIERTNNQYVSSSKKGIVACPTSTGIERFVDVSIDDSKGDNDRIVIVDDNNCSIVGERDIITLLSEKKADGTTPLAGQYTYEIGTSAFAIILVDIERGEHRASSARDIDDGRYWVITSIVFDNSWKKGEEPPADLASTQNHISEQPAEKSIDDNIVRVVTEYGFISCDNINGLREMVLSAAIIAEADLPAARVRAYFSDKGCTFRDIGDKIVIGGDEELRNEVVYGTSGEPLNISLVTIEPVAGGITKEWIVSLWILEFTN